MSLRDYEFVQQVRATGQISISVKGLTRNLECNPAICSGHCCLDHNETLYAAYHPVELQQIRFPEEVSHFLMEENGRIKEDSHHNCFLIPYCQKYPQIIPTDCRLFPLGFNKQGRLVLKRYAWTHPCPGYNKGLPIYISMKNCLIDVLGEFIYNKIVNMIEGVK